jgi:hypothetical protein
MAESIDVVAKLIKRLDKLAEKGILSASRKDMASLKKYEKTFGRMIKGISEAYEQGFEKQAGELEEAQEKMTAQVNKYSASISKCIKKLTTAQTDAEKQAAADRIKSLRQEMSEKLKTHNEMLEAEMKMNKKITDDYKKRQKGLKERAQESFVKLEFGADLEKNLNKMTGALTDFSGATSLINSSISGFARLFASKAAKAAFQHRQGGGEGIGESAAEFKSVSKSLMILGASVGAVFAIFKAFQAIEGAGKKVNKELISNIGATDLMRDGTNDLVSEVDRLRGIITSADFSLDLGLSPEEAQNLVASVSKLGMTFRSMGGDGNKLKNTLMTMREASVSLGISSEDAAGHMNKFRLELGLSENLNKRMGEEFKTIRDLAKQSSFGTADFFNKVKSLTDGLGKLNIRTAQAGRILLNMTKVLGPEAGEAFTKGLIGAFAGEGYVDRIKRLLTTDGKKVTKALASSAKLQAKEFGKNYLGDKFIAEAFGGKYSSGEQILADMQSGKLSSEDLQRVIGKLQTSNSKQAQGASRELYKLMEAGAYTQGRMGQVRALGQADAGSTLATESTRVLGMLGGMKGVLKPGLGGLKMLENMGMSKDQIEDFRKILTLKSAEFESLKGRESLTSEEEKRFGVKKDHQGRLLDRNNEVITSLEDYLLANAEGLQDQFGDMKAPSLESLMKDSIVATQTTADVINAHLGSIMQGVYDVVFGFYNAWFGDKQSDADRASQAGAINQVERTLEELRDNELERSKRRSEIAQELKGEKSLQKRQALQDERKLLDKEEGRSSVQKGQAEESLKFLRSNKLTGGGTVEDKVEKSMKIALGRLHTRGEDLVGAGRVKADDMVQVKMISAAQSLGFNTMEDLVKKATAEGVGSSSSKALMEGLKAQGIDTSADIVTNTLDFLVDNKRFNSDPDRFIEEYSDVGVEANQAGSKAGDFDFNYPSPTSPEARKGRKEDGKEAAEAQAKNSKLQKANEEATYKAQKRIKKEEFEATLRSKLGGLENFGSTKGDLSNLRTRLGGVKETEANKAKLAEAKELFAQAGHLGYVNVNDAGVSKGGGLYIKKGAPSVRTHPQDNALFYKDGGPMDPRMGKGGGGGGGGTAVFNITVNGGPDLEQRVMGVLEKGLKKNRVVVQPN